MREVGGCFAGLRESERAMNHRHFTLYTARIHALSLLVTAVVIGCADSPRLQFEDELDNLFNELVEQIEAYAAGETTKDAAGFSMSYRNEQPMVNPDAVLPVDRSLFIVSLAEDIQDHFNFVSLEFLTQDPDDLDAWETSFQRRYQGHRMRVQESLDKLKERYRSNPDDYVSLMFGRTLGLTSDDHLYFRQGDRGYLIDVMIDVDIKAWLAAVKEQMQK